MTGRSASRRARPFDRVSRAYDSYMQLTGLYREGPILELLGSTAGSRVIDLGGGTGRLASLLAPGCELVVVLDESAGMLARGARRRTLHRVRGDALRACFGDRAFDVALLTDVLHHLRDPCALLAEVRRLLVDGGRLLVYDFDHDHLLARVEQTVERLLFGEIYFRSRAQTQRLLEAGGFSVRRLRAGGSWFIMLLEATS